MAKKSNVGNVYVTVVPSMKGFAKAMNQQVSGINVSQVGKKIGDSIGSSALNALGDKLTTAGNAAESLGGKLAGIGGKLTSGLTVPIVGATAAIGTFAISTASAAETSEIAFTTMLGSAEAAQDMLNQLSDFAAHTPFELSGLVQSTQQLLAYGFAAEEIIPMLTDVGDAVAALGTGQAGIEAVTRALGQMQTRGKVSAEEMLQLTEQGIPAWQYLAEAIGTDTAGAMDKVSDSAVDAATGIKAITDGMERDFGGMMEAQSKTIEGLMSNLSDALTQPLMELRDTEAYANFANALSDVVDAAGPFVESLLPHMERGLDGVADVLEMAANAMDEFSSMSESSQRGIIGIVTAAAAAGPALTVVGKGIQLLGTGLKGAGGVVKTATSLFGKLSDGLLDLATSPKTANTALGSLASTLAAFPTPVGIAATVIGGLLAVAIGDLVAREAEAAEHAQLLSDATMSAAEIMGDASGAAENMGDAIGGIEPDVDGVLQKMKELNQSVGDTFSEQFVDEAKLDQYVKAIDTLANKSELSVTQQYQLQEAVKGYNAIVGTQYQVIDAVNGKIADQDGVVQDNTDLIHQNAEAWRERAKAEAYQNVAVKYMEAEAEAAYELQVAQENLNSARERESELLDIVNGKTGASNEERSRALEELKSVQGQIKELEQGVSDLSDSYETASDNARQFADWAAIEASDASETTKDAAKQISTSLGEMGDAFRNSFDTMGYDVNTLTLKLAEAGVSTEELNEIGSAHLRSLADSCEGDIDRMVWSISNYNNVPIINKDGTVRVEDSQLMDALGNVYTWNGITLVDQNGNAIVDDIDLVDAQGRVFTWNGTALQSKTATVSVDTSDIDRAKALWDRTVFQAKRTSVSAYINNVPAPYATGGIRTHADGGVIATQAVPLDIVGEDGAEAIVPLTNRKYSQPFADIIAEGVLGKMGGTFNQQPINQTINFNQPINTPSQVANTMRRYATYGLAGARR